MFNQLRRSLPLFGSGLIFAITFSAVPAFAQLVGPKSAAELGITVGDSNPGSSREMGFSGGKIITYSNIDTTGYSGFQWGLAADGAKLSLDGPFTGVEGILVTNGRTDPELEALADIVIGSLTELEHALASRRADG